MGSTDFHQLEEDRFAAEAAAMLKSKALAHQFEQLMDQRPVPPQQVLDAHHVQAR